MAGTVFDGIARWDETFYVRSAGRVNEEPDQLREEEATGMLRSLGMEEGQEFQPDAATQAVLKRAIHEACAKFMDRLGTYG